MVKIKNLIVLGIPSATLFANPVFAHHPMGGQVPVTFWQGLLSGFGHPVIGFDHLAFIILVGIAVAFCSLRKILTITFITATVTGCIVSTNGLMLPFLEATIASSVVLAGILVVSGHKYNTKIFAAILAIAGFFHGCAYGAAILGAETSPFLSYLIGFAVIQYCIAMGTSWLILTVWKAKHTQEIQPRIGGAIALGVGLVFLIEQIESLILK